ncbi:MAG: hypothetical protein WCT25_02615 [Candidatus Paceibacterota bacterium]
MQKAKIEKGEWRSRRESGEGKKRRKEKEERKGRERGDGGGVEVGVWVIVKRGFWAYIWWVDLGSVIQDLPTGRQVQDSGFKI